MENNPAENNSEKNNNVITAHLCKSIKSVLLATAVVWVHGTNNHKTLARPLVDQRAQTSLIFESS